MLRGSFLVALLMLGCVHSASAGSDFPPFAPIADFAPPSVVIDSPAGQFDKWIKVLPCGANRATVLVKFDASYRTDKYVPNAKIQLNPLDVGQQADSSHQEVDATITHQDAPFKPWIDIRRVVGTRSEEQGFAFARLDVPLQVDLAWTSGGLVSVNFGGHYELQMGLDKPITRIALFATSAKFEFVDLKVGHAGEPDPACQSQSK
jgi:hypothetical protein